MIMAYKDLTSELEKVILNKICQSRSYSKSFDVIFKNLENKLNEFNPLQNSFELEPFFGEKKREKTAIKLLLEQNKIKKDWIKTYKTKKGKKKEDFKGLYIFYHNSTPFYVGISKGVIGRICQHLKGKTHNNSTLAYKIGLIKYEYENGSPYEGERENFDFISHVEPVKKFLLKQKISILPIDNAEELFLFEVYCSMKLGTWCNDFETH